MKNLAYTAVALTLIGVCATFLAVAGQAHAQSAGAGAVAGSNAVSGSRSASVAASQGGSVNIAAAPSRTTETNTVTYKGSYDVRNVPAVAAPGIITAFNCAHGVSVGGSWLGGGGHHNLFHPLGSLQPFNEQFQHGFTHDFPQGLPGESA